MSLYTDSQLTPAASGREIVAPSAHSRRRLSLVYLMKKYPGWFLGLFTTIYADGEVCAASRREF